MDTYILLDKVHSGSVSKSSEVVVFLLVGLFMKSSVLSL